MLLYSADICALFSRPILSKAQTFSHELQYQYAKSHQSSFNVATAAVAAVARHCLHSKGSVVFISRGLGSPAAAVDPCSTKESKGFKRVFHGVLMNSISG